ncbi:FRG domain-containing protein [Janibacter sp. G349]|uniref:FRG domain-containing protein n=1 Tax=Janibacter sp. G349 TaxID=3405424 RepID=UPI003B7FCFBD
MEQISRSARITPDLSRTLSAALRDLSVVPQFDTSVFMEGLQNLSRSGQFNHLVHDALAPTLQALSDASDFGESNEKSGHSSSFTSPSDYFAKDEVVVNSVDELNKKIATLIEKVPDLELVWRGQRDAEWGIHSSLWRKLLDENGVQPARKEPKSKQPFPTEDQLIEAEANILKSARVRWRFDGMSALETFARLQHFGGPTRLIDVTFNPFVATWFAVESSDEDERDARLFAFATSPTLKAGTTPSIPSRIELDAEWGGRMPAWHSWSDDEARQSVDWGTGANRRLWVPPAYDPRIPAQNAAFLIDGTPLARRNLSPYFNGHSKDGEKVYWSRDDLLESSSIYAKTFNPERKPRPNKHNLAPTFSFRIPAKAKPTIREFLETRMGFTNAHIYPDIAALAQHLSKSPLARLG